MARETDLLAKTVLLVDSNQNLAEARARRLQSYGVTVHTALTVEAARARLEGNEYDLVLIAPRENPEEAIRLEREIKRLHPAQRVAFCVGPPKYISFTYKQNVISMPARSDTWADRVKYRLARA